LVFLITVYVNCGAEKEEDKTGEGTNTAPFIKSAEIVPAVPVLGSRITLRVEAGDKEGDKIDYEVKWFLNGKEIGKGFEFYLEEAKRNDEIFAEITPSDGKSTGETVKTAPVVIGNTPPKITGARISPDTILTSTSDLTVIGEGFDPDGDSLKWLCYWTLDYKERLPDSSTTINLKQLKLKKGSHLTAELYASDGDTVSNLYLLEIDVVNGAPILKESADSIPYTPGSIKFPVPIIDPDNDPLTFELLEAPEGLIIDKKNGIVSGTVAETTAFEILVRATDTEGAYLDARFTLTPPQPATNQ